MKTRQLYATLLATVGLTAAASAGIPEPDYILHGQVCIGGVPASATDDVTVMAKATVESELREVGRYKMGDSDAATDCNGDTDCYILRIRLESVPPGESPSGDAVVLDRSNPSPVQVYLKLGAGAEQLIHQLQVADSGVIQRLDLRDVPTSADLNGDGDTDLLDYQIFRPSFQGPNVAVPGACTAVDLTGDGHVDLRDFAMFQAAFTGTNK